MPAPQYPEDLPLPNTNLSTQSKTPVLRTEMDSGLVRQIARFSTTQRTFSATWTLNATEYATFKTFFYTTLANGTLFFDVTLPTDNGDEDLSLRFVDGTFKDVYQPHGQWNVSATLEEEITQAVADPAAAPVPTWYRPEVLLIGNIEADPSIHRNALFKASPGEGQVYNITVPAIGSLADVLPIGIQLYGAGAVRVMTDGEDPGGGGGGPPALPDWKAIGVALGPMGLWDWSQASSAGSPARVTTCADSSGNGKTVTHNGGTNKLAGTKQGNYLQFAGAECFLDHLTSFTPASTDKREFHYFCVFQLWSPGRNANAKVDQWLLGGAVNTYGRPAFGVKNSDYVANLWSFEHSNSTDISYSTRPACMLMKDVMQVLEVRSIKNGSGCDQTVWLDGFLLGTFSADTTDITGFRMMMGVKHLNANPAAQYMRIRTTAVFDPANLTEGQAATFRSALMQNFNIVDAYA